MTIDTNAASSGGEPVVTPAIEIPVHTPGREGAMSMREAANSVIDWRRKRDAGETSTEQPQERADPAAPAKQSAEESIQQSSLEPDAGEPKAPPGETESPDPATQLPPIEPPRSWTKEDKELFQNLPRETQQRLSERERSRDSDISRRQQEAAERAKALEAERVRTDQARERYEVALPLLLQSLQRQQAGDFADIKSMADVERLAREDAPRYAVWDAQQRQIAGVTQEVSAAHQRQLAEQQARFTEFAKRESELFVDKVPEFADKDTAAKLQSSAVDVLTGFGFSGDELTRLWRGETTLSLHDHRLQLLILDGVRYREAQAKAKEAQARSVPPVQRPGVTQSRNAARDAQVQDLTTRLEKTGSLKDAAALLRARRAAR